MSNDGSNNKNRTTKHGNFDLCIKYSIAIMLTNQLDNENGMGDYLCLYFLFSCYMRIERKKLSSNRNKNDTNAKNIYSGVKKQKKTSTTATPKCIK